MKKHSIQHHIDTLAVLLLFGVFAVCVLSVLLTGADAYRRMTERDNRAYDRRTCVQYVVTEFGVADLKYKSTVERARALIAIAHPDFRRELERQMPL